MRKLTNNFTEGVTRLFTLLVRSLYYACCTNAVDYVAFMGMEAGHYPDTEQAKPKPKKPPREIKRSLYTTVGLYFALVTIILLLAPGIIVLCYPVVLDDFEPVLVVGGATFLLAIFYLIRGRKQSWT